MLRSLRGPSGAIALLAVVAGCTSRMSGSPATGGMGGTEASAGGGAGTSPGGTTGMAAAVDPTDSALDRLTRVEYLRTVEAAFPGMALPAVELPADGTDGIFTTNAPSRLSDFTAYFEAAETLGATIAEKLVARCTWAETSAACVHDQLGPALRVAYRRPSTTNDETVLSSLLSRRLAEGAPVEEALATAVARLLLTPDFLFRMERGVASLPNGAGRRLSDHEVAARLAYLLTDAPPDATLLALADSGALGDRERLRAEAARLFDGPLGEAAAWRFVVEWLDLDNLEKRPQTGDLGSDVVASMHAETRALVDHVLHQDQAPVRELFTAPYTFLDARMAEHYGVRGTFTDEPERYDWKGEQARNGVLTHASLLTALTSSSRDKDVIPRGRVIYTRLLCGELELPDAALMNQEVADRTKDPRCAGCHSLMDPMGRAFAVYDGVGRYQSATVVPGVIDTGEVQGSFSSVAELGGLIVASERFETCVTELAFRQAFGRRPRPAEADLLATLHTAFAGRGSFRDLMLTLVSSDAFRERYDSAEENRCAP
jgi:hypothetical protein